MKIEDKTEELEADKKEMAEAGIGLACNRRVSITMDRYEFVEILLPDGKRVTVDSSFGQLYYKLAEKTEGILLTADCRETRSLDGVVMADFDVSGKLVGIEIIP
jgi:uncharacterized protein YuzE